MSTRSGMFNYGLNRQTLSRQSRQHRVRDRQRARSRRLTTESLEPRRVLSARLDGHIWFDGNQNGMQDHPDVYVADVEVRLLDGSGSVVAESLADANGEFSFRDLEPRSYQIEVTPPDGTEFTIQTDVQNGGSAVNPSTGRSEIIAVTDRTYLSVGLISPEGTGVIRGHVWNDLNGDGIRDVNEPGFAGAEVQVENRHLENIFEVYTDDNGNYEIDSAILPPGQYVLDFKRPGRNGGLRWEVSPYAVPGVDQSLNNDATSVNGKTAFFTLEPTVGDAQPPDIVLDAGFNRLGYISGTVESVIGYRMEDVQVQLRSGETIIASTVTGRNGGFEFAGLKSGQYEVAVSVPDDVSYSGSIYGVEEEVMFNADVSPTFDLASGTTQQVVFVLRPRIGTNSISGRVWHDLNANGIQEAGEPPIDDVSLGLENSRLSFIKYMQSNNGQFTLNGADLFSGQFVIHVSDVYTIPTLGGYRDGYKVSPLDATDDTLDNDIQSLSGRSKFIHLPPLSSADDRQTLEIGVGLYRFGSITGHVWDDVDRNGSQRGNERLIGSVQARLRNSDDELIDTVRAGLDGQFSFYEIVPGDYTVEILGPEGTRFSPVGQSVFGSDVDPISGRMRVAVQSGQAVPVRAGIYGLNDQTTLSGIAWDDTNGDGIRDADEIGLPGVLVELHDERGTRVLQQLTDQAGAYHMTLHVSGSFSVSFVAPDGATLSPMNMGGNDTLDSDVNRFSQRTSYIPVVAGQQTTNLNAGIYRGEVSDNARANIRVSEVGFIGHGYSEFVEIKNVGDVPVNIDGVRFSKGVKFDFSTSSTKSLFPGEHAVVVGETHTLGQRVDLNEINVAGEYSGDLDRDETLTLVDATDSTIVSFRYDDDWFVILDSEFLPWTLTTVDDHAPPEAWDTRANWRPSSFVQGSPGTDDPRITPDPGTLVINEVVPKSNDGFNDLVEIYNNSDVDIDISHWYLGDSNQSVEPLVYLTRYRFAEGTVVPANGYLVITREDNFGNVDDPGTGSPFGLSSFGEGLNLIAADARGNMLGYSDTAFFDGSTTGTSYGRYVTRSGDVVFVELQEATIGGQNAEPSIGDVLISEIMYKPAGEKGEYIRIVNVSNESVRLDSGYQPWGLDGAVQFTFPPGAVLGLGSEAFIVSQHPDVYRSENVVPEGVHVYGPFRGKLSDSQDNVRIYRFDDLDPRRFIVDQVTYADDTPWPRQPDLGGVALVRVSTSVIGDDPFNWTHSAMIGDINLDGVVDTLDFSVWQENRFSEDSLWTSGDLDGNRIVDASDFNIWNDHRFNRQTVVGRAARTPQAAIAQSVAVIIAEPDDTAVRRKMLGTDEAMTQVSLQSRSAIEDLGMSRESASKMWNRDVTSRRRSMADDTESTDDVGQDLESQAVDTAIRSLEW